MEMPVTIRGEAVVTVEHSQEGSSRPKSVGVASVTTIDLRRTHSLLCCLVPQKSITITDGTFLKLEYHACLSCTRCIEHILPPILPVHPTPGHILPLTDLI